MKTNADLANDIVDIWLDHALGTHPDTMLELIREGFADRTGCNVCNSLHEQLKRVGGVEE